MFERLALKWSDWLVEHGADPDNRAVMAYGFECLLNEMTATILVFAVAFVIGRPLEMLIWQIFWLPFRINLGGHHSSSHLWCIIYSTALAVGCVLIVPFLVLIPWIIWIEIAASIIIAFSIAPVVHPNRLISDERKAKYKQYGRIICIVESAVITLLVFVAPVWLTQTAGIGMGSAAILCLVGKYTNPRVNDNP